jgi:hypothetical protein
VAGGRCFSQDLCSLLSQERSLAGPFNADARTVLDTLGHVVPFESGAIRLFSSSNTLVKQKGGAAAALCGQNANERWIFFDPGYLDAIKPNGGKSDLPRYFVLAHEAAHHINGDTLVGTDWTKDQELQADLSAAEWLTRLGVPRGELLQAFDALPLPTESVGGYPTKEERRAKVIQGYEDAASRPSPRPGEGTPPQPSNGLAPQPQNCSPVYKKPVFNPYPVSWQNHAGSDCTDYPVLSGGITTQQHYARDFPADPGDIVMMRIYVNNGAGDNTGAVMHNVRVNTIIEDSGSITTTLSASNARSLRGTAQIRLARGTRLELVSGNPNPVIGDLEPHFAASRQFFFKVKVVPR